MNTWLSNFKIKIILFFLIINVHGFSQIPFKKEYSDKSAINEVVILKIDKSSLINKEDSAISVFYQKYKIENKSAFPIKVTLQLPYGEYRNCIADTKNFAIEGTWIKVKIIPPNSSDFMLIRDKTKSIYMNGRYYKCTGISSTKFSADYIK